MFAWIDAEKAEFPITKLCQYLQVSPSGFYAARGRPESARTQTDLRLRVLVRASFDESHQRYGSPRIHEDLIEQGERVSRKRVIRLMQEDGLEARARKRFTCTTMSDHDQPVAANLLDRCFEAPGPNQRWVGDTTEFVIGSSGKLYLAVVLDLFSRFVVGWAVSAVNDRHVTIKALDMALKRRCPDAGLLHHSDQGCTYASEDYQTILGARGIVCSMSRRGNCYDNAVMESFFSTVKSELVDRFDSFGEAKMELFNYLEVFYNQRRRHSTLGQISPAVFERRAAQAAQLNRPPNRIKLTPATTFLAPSRTMACASTAAVVVPSPAMSDVLLATSRTIWAPMFWSGSLSSISFATVTPSLVIVGDPNFLSSTTLRPLGPRVTFTASASWFTPARIIRRDVSPYTICFAMFWNSHHSFNVVLCRFGRPLRERGGRGTTSFCRSQ